MTVKNVGLNLTFPSNVLHLRLKWLQNTSSHAPELFINNITIKGIASDDKGADDQNENDENGKNKNKNSNNASTGNQGKCKIDKVIDFRQVKDR